MPLQEEFPGITGLVNLGSNFVENTNRVLEGAGQIQSGKDSTQVNEEARPIGSEAILNGKPVFWAGQNYGYQTKESYDKLMDEGQFRMGEITAQRIGNSISQAIPQEAKDFATEKITDAATAAEDFYNQQDYDTQQNIKTGLKFAYGAVTTIDKGLEFISEKTNTSRFITDELVTAAATGGASVALKRAAPIVKQAGKTAVNVIDTAIDDILTPPGGGLQLATAGSAPMGLAPSASNGSITLRPQVMKAVTAKNPEILALGGVKRGDDITSPEQAKHLTRRAKEVQERVDKLPLMRDQLNEMIESGADLKKIKRFRSTIDDTKAMLHRKRSNVSVPTEKDPLWYQTTAGKAAKKQEEITRSLKAGEYLEAHHLFPKVLSSAFFDRMDWMINKGKAEIDDLVLMNNIAIKLGRKPGDYKSNMLNMRQNPHNELHTAMDYAKDEFNEVEWAKKVSKAKDVDELLILWRDTIKNTVLPTAEDAISINKLDKTIESVSPKFTGSKKPSKEIFQNLRDKQLSK